RTGPGCRCRLRAPTGNSFSTMIRRLRKRLARAIIIDRATPDSRSLIGYVARQRTEENYRFASRFVSGKAVLDIGGGTGVGHDLVLASGAASLLSLDRHPASSVAGHDQRIQLVQADFLTWQAPRQF